MRTSAGTEGEEAIAGLERVQIAFERRGSSISPYAPVNAGMLKLFDPEVNSAQGLRATSHHGVC